ncbi:hypothetical protein AVEN_95218-1 [Araneus ventricosus]|uniref:Uncharacterized protein n=1 Tax=Araneus ventricosus TaxID=182803 RepID=A0A4Y2DHR9_ARAVE|nr:hypothetical protein AVEN_95218-1 [Araneus ventricosus]
MGCFSRSCCDCGEGIVAQGEAWCDMKCCLVPEALVARAFYGGLRVSILSCRNLIMFLIRALEWTFPATLLIQTSCRFWEEAVMCKGIAAVHSVAKCIGEPTLSQPHMSFGSSLNLW